MMGKVFLIFCLGHQFFQVLDYIPRTRIISISYSRLMLIVFVLYIVGQIFRGQVHMYICAL